MSHWGYGIPILLGIKNMCLHISVCLWHCNAFSFCQLVVYVALLVHEHFLALSLLANISFILGTSRPKKFLSRQVFTLKENGRIYHIAMQWLAFLFGGVRLGI